MSRRDLPVSSYLPSNSLSDVLICVYNYLQDSVVRTNCGWYEIEAVELCAMRRDPVDGKTKMMGLVRWCKSWVPMNDIYKCVPVQSAAKISTRARRIHECRFCRTRLSRRDALIRHERFTCVAPGSPHHICSDACPVGCPGPKVPYSPPSDGRNKAGEGENGQQTDDSSAFDQQ